MDAARFIHLSDLHLGRSAQTNAVAAELIDTIVEVGIDHVLVSGDITDHGRSSELELFWQLAEPIRDRMTLVPGNHDRLGDDLRDAIMPGKRVQVDTARGLYLVRVDSTGPHNRNFLAGHGRLLPEDVDEVEEALSAAPEGSLRVVTLHHHPLPLPEDHFVERISSHFRLPFTEELELGWELVQAINGKCDLVLHGHRHSATAHSIEVNSERPT
ncbi:MAG: metallophosphoesterase, partial [Myxococcota bacterium]